MKIAVIGLGSMGKRRIRLLLRYAKENGFESHERWQVYGVDSQEERRREAEAMFGITTCSSLDEALRIVDAVVISTSPLAHSSIIKTCLTTGKDVFTELNLVADGYEENIKLAAEKERVLFLSSTMLYREENKYIIEAARTEEMPLNYIYHVGQYLPDWHPWENVNDYFVGQKKTNGCREIFAIELPWLQKAFGEIRKFTVSNSRNTKLNIDYCNNYLLLVEHENENGILHKGIIAVDVMSRKAVRNFEMFNENVYLSWAGHPRSLCRHNNKTGKEEMIELYDEVEREEGYKEFIIENAYYSEIEAYIHAIEKHDVAMAGAYSFKDDMQTLSLIDRIESAL